MGWLVMGGLDAKWPDGGEPSDHYYGEAPFTSFVVHEVSIAEVIEP
ncbi:hypothetical protein BH09BAC1_BH09BAC1_13250 [soil metagenome]